jgi:hypothetical protein
MKIKTMVKAIRIMAKKEWLFDNFVIKMTFYLNILTYNIIEIKKYQMAQRIKYKVISYSS